MKSITVLLFLAFFTLFSSSINAQDDFYNEPVKKEKKESRKKIKEKVPSIDDYVTEVDYEEKNGRNYEVFTEDEEQGKAYDPEEKPKKRKNSVAGEVVAEIVFEVFINTALIVATCWW